MENNKFDEFIRVNTQRDLKSPEELNWENMDIPLPAGGFVKTNPFSTVGFGVILLVVSAIVILGYFGIKKLNTKQPLNNTSAISSTNSNEENLLTDKPQKNKTKPVKDATKNNLASSAVEPLKTAKAALTKESRKQQLFISDKKIDKPKPSFQQNSITKNSAKNKKADKPHKNLISKSPTTQFIQKNNGSVKNSFQPIEKNSVVQSLEESNRMQKNPPQLLQENTTEQLIEKNTKKQEDANQSIETSSNSIAKNTKQNTPTNTQKPAIKIGLTQGIESITAANLSNLSLLSEGLDTSKQRINLPEAKQGKYSLSLSGGYNRMISSFSPDIQMDSLSKTESAEWGNSYKLSFERRLKKNYFVSIGIAYNSLRTTLNYRKELDDDFVNFQRVRKSRYVFHNNYFNFVQFRVGAGKSILFNKHWSSQVIAYLSPSLKTCQTGRTLDENKSIVSIEELATEKDWFLSASIDWRLTYQLRSINIFTGAGFNQNLSNGEFLKDYTNSSLYKQSVSFYLGLKRDF